MPGLTVDRLDGGAVEVLRLAGARFGGEAAREPHRHDYHELIWVRAGRGQHLLDGRPFPVRAHSINAVSPYGPVALALSPASSSRPIDAALPLIQAS